VSAKAFASRAPVCSTLLGLCFDRDLDSCLSSPPLLLACYSGRRATEGVARVGGCDVGVMAAGRGCIFFCIYSAMVYWFDSDVGNFLIKFDQNISVLYLDPPWAVGSDPSSISPLSEIRRFLKHNVFDHLRREAYPQIICFKLPRKAEDIEEWPELAAPYVSVDHDFMRNSYHIHILRIARG